MTMGTGSSERLDPVLERKLECPLGRLLEDFELRVRLIERSKLRPRCDLRCDFDARLLFDTFFMTQQKNIVNRKTVGCLEDMHVCAE